MTYKPARRPSEQFSSGGDGGGGGVGGLATYITIDSTTPYWSRVAQEQAAYEAEIRGIRFVDWRTCEHAFAYQNFLLPPGGYASCHLCGMVLTDAEIDSEEVPERFRA